MRILIISIFIFQTFVGFTQPAVAKEVVKGGKTYYKHKVEAGNTLWGLQQIYNVDVETIVIENPFLTEGIKTGQIVFIPKIEKVKVEEVTYSDYKVKSSETLYGLSKKFKTTVDNLIVINPELSEGLKKGQIIKVPGSFKEEIEEAKTETVETEIKEEVPNPFVVEPTEGNGVKETVKISFSDSTIRHSVLSHETMYSISKRFMVSIDEVMKINGLKKSSVKEGQILIIPVKNERIEKVDVREISISAQTNAASAIDFEPKDEYTVALFLPLFLEYGKGYSEYVADLATQFYMGAILAMDSLESKGLKAKIHVFDTRNDSVTIVNILNSSLFDNVDLIIGPLLGENINQVAAFCEGKQIRMICPVACDSDILENNPYFYSAVPSNISLMNGLARFMAENYRNDNIILIKPTDKESIPLYEAYRNTFNSTPIEGGRSHLIEASTTSFNTYIKRGVNNRFVVPTIDKSAAMKFMNNLNRSAFRSKADDLFVYGTKEWVDFTDINNIYKNKYNFQFPSPNHLDYYKENVVTLNKIYRSNYKTDLTKMAVQGYDVLLYFSSLFFLDDSQSHLMMNEFEMNNVSDGDGQENSHVFIIEQDDFNLTEVGGLD